MFTNRRASLVLAVALTAAAATQASAESRAWTAAKKALPANLMGVGGLNFGAIRTSQLFQQLMPMAMASQPDAQANLDKFKQACGFDPMTSFDSAAGGANATGDQFVVVVALSGITQKDVDACIVKASAAENHKVTVTKAGALTKYAGLDGKDVYIKWLDKDVLALVSKPEDKALLTKMTAGGVTGDKALKAGLGSVNTDAAFWAVGNKKQDIPDIKAKMVGAYGSIDLKAGTIAAEVHAILDSAKAATDAAAMGTQQLAAVKQSGQVPAAFNGVLSSIAIKSVGTEVVVTGSIAEKDVMSLLAMFGGMGGGGGSGMQKPPVAPTAPPPKSSGGLKPH